LNDFIQKEIQYKDCLEKSVVVLIRQHKIHFYSKIIGSFFRTDLKQWRLSLCQLGAVEKCILRCLNHS
jgi:hypothetical protein